MKKSPLAAAALALMLAAAPVTLFAQDQAPQDKPSQEEHKEMRRPPRDDNGKQHARPEGGEHMKSPPHDGKDGKDGKGRPPEDGRGSTNGEHMKRPPEKGGDNGGRPSGDHPSEGRPQDDGNNQ
ncbi:hypothetical protein dsx2_2382 [Desulfovibrio sp. X2]|uniref:hypothetical protein n=1 Tax=Desulfovibrio sp. X2 TaxID=941449 RepID=UPI000358F4DF|nr:hypothetical protein [Desulfovibrio sp. X2]EPR43531.1 hypothetical protein dsx2_2382 [Desulfovibrio sp. X2]